MQSESVSDVHCSRYLEPFCPTKEARAGVVNPATAIKKAATAVRAFFMVTYFLLYPVGQVGLTSDIDLVSLPLMQVIVDFTVVLACDGDVVGEARVGFEEAAGAGVPSCVSFTLIVGDE